MFTYLPQGYGCAIADRSHVLVGGSPLRYDDRFRRGTDQLHPPFHQLGHSQKTHQGGF